jgi:hypothetical protein
MGEVERVQKLIFFIFFLLLRGRGVEVFFFFLPDVLKGGIMRGKGVHLGFREMFMSLCI